MLNQHRQNNFTLDLEWPGGQLDSDVSYLMMWVSARTWHCCCPDAFLTIKTWQRQILPIVPVPTYTPCHSCHPLYINVLAAYNTLASGSTFGATNLYGWTRSIIQGTARSFGTKIAQGEIKEGGFATGATTVNGNTARWEMIAKTWVASQFKIQILGSNSLSACGWMPERPYWWNWVACDVFGLDPNSVLKHRLQLELDYEPWYRIWLESPSKS